MSAIKPVCLPLECVVNDVNLLRNTFLTHELEFSLHIWPKSVNFLESISSSIGNTPNKLKAASVRVRLLSDCICLTQNLWARSNDSISLSVKSNQFSHPYSALGKTTELYILMHVSGCKLLVKNSAVYET